MKTIEERADRAIYEPTDGHPLNACEVVAFARGYELGATEQKAIDDAKLLKLKSAWEKEENIIVPRWFLESVEDTLRIQHNINQPDMKKTGETCQDRNIRQSLNELHKLLKGEELNGMERFEKIVW